VVAAFVVIYLFLIGPVFAAFTSKVAREKGYGNTAWVFGGYFFSIVALLAAVGLPKKEKSNP
jgi:hypothetical protein